MTQMHNITLIGMPGVGKSTVGVLLAKELGYPFLDTDIVIQSRVGKKLATIIAEHGIRYFKQLEEQFVCELNVARTVIATGGSVVYSERAMRHLKTNGVIVWLHLASEELRERLGDLQARGVVMAAGQTLEQLYRERQPLYASYADLTVDCDRLAPCQVLSRVLAALHP